MPAPTERFDLHGRVALVTGGSRGLGRAIVLGLAEAGADVAITSRKHDACVAVAREVEGLGRRAFVHACHVGRWEELPGLVDAVYDHFGRIDILVNNAGLSPLAPSSVETSEALFDKVVAVNLKGPFRLSALVGSRMAADGGGSIVNVSSTASVRPSPSTAPYAAAKAGLNAITVALAHEYGPAVRVNAIVCGAFHTDATRAWSRSDAFAAVARRTLALQRAADPEEVVGTALYLASAASSYTTGALIPVHGGIS